MIIPELLASPLKNTRLSKCEPWSICLLILQLRFKLTPENYFQATFCKPNMSMLWLMAVLSVWVVSALVLLSALRVVKVLGLCGLMACERLMGMLSVQMLLDDISNYLK